MLESRYKAELVREKQAEMIANGLGNPRATLYVLTEQFNGNQIKYQHSSKSVFWVLEEMLIL
ncbi:MAG: hypothetical protein CM15mV46_040 [Caudoviricetes sp.]|nr:MAG: hypothetical protein CM15mV46_040 [Caudoviricetes sp.]